MLALQYFDDNYETSKGEMQQSVTFKARVDNIQATEEAIFELTESLGTLFEQEDVYFNAPRGNLKLRIMHPNRCGQLIYNAMSKKLDHKLSESQITEVEDVYSMRATLGAALGERGVIQKKRRVFLSEGLRIYLDEVDEIGHFIDVAITIPSGGDASSTAAVEARVSDVRSRLHIQDSSIVPVAYLDLLINNLSFDESISSSESAASTSSADDSDA